MTRIIGTLSWFDESAERIAACVAGMARFCDHVICVDGRYAQFDAEHQRSSTREHMALVDVAHAAGVGLTLHTVTEPFRDEMAKRTLVFQLAAAVGEVFRDWVFICDADEVVAQAPTRSVMRAMLEDAAAQDCDVAMATLWEQADPEGTPERAKASAKLNIPYDYSTPQPRFWRLLEDMRVVGYHYNYVGTREDGSLAELWGDDEHIDRRADWFRDTQSRVVIENRNRLRSRVRNQAREAYYATRDESAVELHAPLSVLEERYAEHR